MGNINIQISSSAVELLDRIIAHSNGYNDSKAGNMIDFERWQTRRRLEWDRESFIEMLIYEYAESLLGIIQDEDD